VLEPGVEPTGTAETRDASISKRANEASVYERDQHSHLSTRTGASECLKVDPPAMMYESVYVPGLETRLSQTLKPIIFSAARQAGDDATRLLDADRPCRPSTGRDRHTTRPVPPCGAPLQQARRQRNRFLARSHRTVLPQCWRPAAHST